MAPTYPDSSTPPLDWQNMCVDVLLGEKRKIPPLTDIADAKIVTPEHIAQIRAMLAFKGKPASTGQIHAVPISLHGPGHSVEIDLSGFVTTAVKKDSGIHVVQIQRAEDTDLGDLQVPEGTGLVAFVNSVPYLLDQKSIVGSRQFIFNVPLSGEATQPPDSVYVPLFVAAPVNPAVVKDNPQHSAVMCFLYPPEAIGVTLHQNGQQLIRPRGGMSPSTARRLG